MIALSAKNLALLNFEFRLAEQPAVAKLAELLQLREGVVHGVAGRWRWCRLRRRRLLLLLLRVLLIFLLRPASGLTA
jgi:hypothetical protein